MTTKAIREALALLGRTRTDDLGTVDRVMKAAEAELAAISSVPEDVARDRALVEAHVYEDHVSNALTRLATAAARVPGLVKEVGRLNASLEESGVMQRQLENTVSKVTASLRGAESERDAAQRDLVGVINERDALTTKVAELERENAPNGNDLTALRAALASIFPGVSFQWSALPSMLLALDSQRGEAEARATAAGNAVAYLRGLAMGGPRMDAEGEAALVSDLEDVLKGKPTPAPGGGCGPCSDGECQTHPHNDHGTTPAPTPAPGLREPEPRDVLAMMQPMRPDLEDMNAPYVTGYTEGIRDDRARRAASAALGAPGLREAVGRLFDGASDPDSAAVYVMVPVDDWNALRATYDATHSKPARTSSVATSCTCAGEGTCAWCDAMVAPEPVVTHAPVPMLLSCPACGTPHHDTGEWATRPHKTHLCLNPACGKTWRPYEFPTVGVAAVTHAQLAAVVEALRSETPFDGYPVAQKALDEVLCRVTGGDVPRVLTEAEVRDAFEFLPGGDRYECPQWGPDDFREAIRLAREFLGLTLPTGPGGGGGDWPAPPHHRCEMKCLVGRPDGCAGPEMAGIRDGVGVTPRARIAPTPTPEGPALAFEFLCRGDAHEFLKGADVCKCGAVPRAHDVEPEPAGPEVVWEAPGSVRVVGPVGEERAEVKGKDGEWYEANVGGWAYVLARALAEAKRENARLLKEMDVPPGFRLWDRCNDALQREARKSAEAMRERAATHLKRLLPYIADRTSRGTLETAIQAILALPLEDL